MEFDLGHNKAFEMLGALPPGQHWSSFDVLRPEAKKGMASKFVTTIWNWHSSIDANGKRVPTELAICRAADGSLWYQMVGLVGDAVRPTHIAHWNGLKLALSTGLPIIGILKDVETKRCASNGVFEIEDCYEEPNDAAIWLRLSPRHSSDFPTRRLKVSDEFNPLGYLQTLEKIEGRFKEAIRDSKELERTERLQQLHNASSLPERIEVTTYAYLRNPHVVTEALIRADGKCEGCGAPAPFIRRADGSPYLEVHHEVPLANGGEDTLDNAVALCPNCHRERHYA